MSFPKAVSLLLLCSVAAFAAAEEGSLATRLDTLRQQVGTLASVQIPAIPNDHECNIKSASCNTTFIADVNIFGCRTDNFLYFNTYRLSVAANTRVTVSATSNSYRSFIVVFSEPSLDVIGSDLKAIRSTASVTFSNTSSTAQSYLFTVGPGDDLDSGQFTTTVTCVPLTSGLCTPATSTLCLNNNRFAVTTTWRTATGSGSGSAVSMSADTGHFWFFSSANVELVVKVLDGRGINGKFWVFYGALSDVEYTITVRDTQTGATKTYFNPQGRLASASDVNAF